MKEKTSSSDYKSTSLCWKLSDRKPIFCVFYDRPMDCLYVEKISLGRCPNSDDYLYKVTVEPHINSHCQDVSHWINILKGTRVLRVDAQGLLECDKINTWNDLAVLWKVSEEMAREIARVSCDELYLKISSKEKSRRCNMYNEIFAQTI